MFNKLLRRAMMCALLFGAVAIQGCGSGGGGNDASTTAMYVCADGTKVHGGKQNCPATGTTSPTTTPPTTTTTTPPPTTTTPTPDTSAGDTTVGVGLSPIADNFDTNTGIYTNGRGVPAASTDRNGSFRLVCGAGPLLYDDPVVYPGQPGKSHLHQFVGNLAVNANSTYQSLRTTGQSTCQNPDKGPVNRSAYWFPAMLNGIGGVVKPDVWHLYYKRLPKDDPACTAAAGGSCVAIPNGLHFVIGYNMTTMSEGVLDKTSGFYWASRWQCFSGDLKTIKADGWQYRTLQSLMDSHICQVGDVARVLLSGPACWDGKNVDSADHRSHLSYKITDTGLGVPICPDDHPYMLPSPGGFIDFTVDQEFVDGKWLLSSDQMMRDMGHPVVAGETFHFDYIEAWSPAIKAKWTTNCLDGHLNCNIGELGDGTSMNTRPEPHVTHEVVPVPPRPGA